LHLTLVYSAAGNWVKGSPIITCPGDRYVGLKGSSDRAPTFWNLDRPLSLQVMWKVLHR